jgi:S-adenosylmethionine:tRNA ribosyltransferase-isomerase
MPSAGRPFTERVLRALKGRGVEIAPILLHTGVSSLEMRDAAPGSLPVYPEPFEVPESTARKVNETRCAGGRVVAVGTTVVRALESANTPSGVRAARGFTRAFIRPERPVAAVDGLVTGLHDRGTTHLAMLESLVAASRLRKAYERAVAAGLRWHEFGDSHLVWRPGISGDQAA